MDNVIWKYVWFGHIYRNVHCTYVYHITVWRLCLIHTQTHIHTYAGCAGHDSYGTNRCLILPLCISFSPLYWQRSTLIPASISSYIHYNGWSEITYPFPNLNCANVEYWVWTSYLISRLYWARDYLSMLGLKLIRRCACYCCTIHPKIMATALEMNLQKGSALLIPTIRKHIVHSNSVSNH